MNHPNIADIILLVLTAVVAGYLLWRFWTRHMKRAGLYDVYYMLGFTVLAIACLLLIFKGYEVLASPYMLTVATLIPLGIAMGLVEEFYPAWKRPFKWIALVGLIAIAVTSIGGMETLRKIAVPVFHGIAGLTILFVPIFARKAPAGFWWVSVGGALIGIGGVSLTILSTGRQLMFLSSAFVMSAFSTLLMLMALAFAYGFVKDVRAQASMDRG